MDDHKRSAESRAEMLRYVREIRRMRDELDSGVRGDEALNNTQGNKVSKERAVKEWVDNLPQDGATNISKSRDDKASGMLKSTHKIPSVERGPSSEDDLSLGAEAQCLRAVQQSDGHAHHAAQLTRSSTLKRRQAWQNSRSINKESFNSEMSGQTLASQPSSIELLLAGRRNDPEELLRRLGFGTDNVASITARIPARFLQNKSAAHGINVRRYLGDDGGADESGANSPTGKREFLQFASLEDLLTYLVASGVPKRFMAPYIERYLRDQVQKQHEEMRQAQQETASAPGAMRQQKGRRPPAQITENVAAPLGDEFISMDTGAPNCQAGVFGQQQLAFVAEAPPVRRDDGDYDHGHALINPARSVTRVTPSDSFMRVTPSYQTVVSSTDARLGHGNELARIHGNDTARFRSNDSTRVRTRAHIPQSNGFSSKHSTPLVDVNGTGLTSDTCYRNGTMLSEKERLSTEDALYCHRLKTMFSPQLAGSRRESFHKALFRSESAENVSKNVSNRTRKPLLSGNSFDDSRSLSRQPASVGCHLGPNRPPLAKKMRASTTASSPLSPERPRTLEFPPTKAEVGPREGSDSESSSTLAYVKVNTLKHLHLSPDESLV